MGIEILGDAPPVKRLETGLHSFDRAFINRKGEIGFPIGKATEIFGVTFCGKSTITYGIAGLIAKYLNGNIALADLEGFDPDFLSDVLETVGFNKSVQYVQEETDEEVLDTLVNVLRDEDYCVGILDSIAAISPISEQEGEIGDANMGRRALAMAQFSRKMLKVLRDNEENKSLLTVNHAYPRIGGMGMETPGGEVKKYLMSIRIQVKRRYLKSGYQEYPDGSYVIEGKVVKNRWGIKDLAFLLFVLSGKGIHLGMTAMEDCIKLELATRNRAVVKIDDQSFGHMKKIIEEAQAGNEEFFQPFIDLLYPKEDKNENG